MPTILLPHDTMAEDFAGKSCLYRKPILFRILGSPHVEFQGKTMHFMKQNCPENHFVLTRRLPLKEPVNNLSFGVIN